MNVARSPWWVVVLWLSTVALWIVGLFRTVELAVLALTGADRANDAAPLVAGIVVAITLVALLGTWWRSRRRSSFSTAFSPDVPGQQPDEARLREFEESVRLATDVSELRRVIPIGRTVRAGEVTVDVLSLEVRERVARLQLAIIDTEGGRREDEFRTLMEKTKRPDPSLFPFPLNPVLTLTDDIGTRYTALSPGGGGSGGLTREEVLFVPTVPDEATRLGFVLHRLTDSAIFEPPDSPRVRRTIEGPWHFEVQI